MRRDSPISITTIVVWTFVALGTLVSILATNLRMARFVWPVLAVVLMIYAGLWLIFGLAKYDPIRFGDRKPRECPDCGKIAVLPARISHSVEASDTWGDTLKCTIDNLIVEQCQACSKIIFPPSAQDQINKELFKRNLSARATATRSRRSKW